jgi:hypothetical protein
LINTTYLYPKLFHVDPTRISSPTHPSNLTFLTHRRSAQHIQALCNPRPNHGYTSDEPRNGCKEVTKQDQNAIQLNDEAKEGPAHEYECDANAKSQRAFPFLFAREEGEGFRCANYEREADEEENLRLYQTE